MRPCVGRRLLCAGVALAIAFALFRSQIADGLVVRGDESLYRADSSSALGYYSRALAFDADSAAAVDRYAFVAAMLREPRDLRAAVAICSRYLTRHGRDSVVRMDRAMAERSLGDHRRAFDDFRTVGQATSNAAAFAFAGSEAAKLRRRDLADPMWRSALRLAPGFPIALHALRRERSH